MKMKMKFPLGRNIIPLFGHKKDKQFSVLTEVTAYWHGLRSGRIVPLRSEIDPRGIESALEYTFILERIAPGLARFRLAGSHLGDLLGMDVRGMPFTSFFTPGSRQAIMGHMEKVFDGPCTVELSLLAEKGIGRPHIEAKVILLPIRSDDGQISRIIGCLVTEGNIGRVPRRFEICGEKTVQLQPETGGYDIEKLKPVQTVRKTIRHDTPPIRSIGQPKLRLVVVND